MMDHDEGVALWDGNWHKQHVLAVEWPACHKLSATSRLIALDLPAMLLLCTMLAVPPTPSRTHC
jgi:hypothetical protein